MATFNIKAGDTSPSILYTLSPAVDITGATVVFSLRSEAGVVILNKVAATIVDAENGIVRYDWAAGIAAPGDYEAEFQVTYADASIETYPNDGYIAVVVAEQVA